MAQSNIYGKDKAKDMLIEAVVCDGNPERSSRFDIFNANHNLIGICTGPHSTDKNITCIIYCGWFTRHGDKSLLQAKMQEFQASPIIPPPIPPEVPVANLEVRAVVKMKSGVKAER